MSAEFNMPTCGNTAVCRLCKDKVISISSIRFWTKVTQAGLPRKAFPRKQASPEPSNHATATTDQNQRNSNKFPFFFQTAALLSTQLIYSGWPAQRMHMYLSVFSSVVEQATPQIRQWPTRAALKRRQLELFSQ